MLLQSELVGQYVPQPTAASPLNGPIQKLVSHVSPHGWLYFRDNLSIPDSQIFQTYGQFFGLGPENEMRMERRKLDREGRSIARFRQYFNGIPVEGGEYSLHSQNGTLILGHGKIIEDLDLDPRPETEELYALRKALSQLEAQTYAWQDPSWEETIQEERADSTARYFPKGELRFMLHSGEQLIKSNYRLAWYFEIRTLSPDDFLAVYVDAKSAEILRIGSLRRFCSHQSGTAKTLYNNYQSLDMTQRGWPHNDYSLRDCRNIQTKYHARNSFGETRGWKWVSQITHSDNDWDETDRVATSAHWAAQQAWDYFEENFGLNGPDDQEKATRIWVDWTDANENPVPDAMFEPSSKSNYLYIGTKDGQSLATLDVVGHEYTHGVVAGSAGLVYERESGALDESFADIFGLLIECFGQNETNPSDWLIGEDASSLRSLSNPAAYGQPQFYGGSDPNWQEATTEGCPIPLAGYAPLGNDFCGVHTNGGVQNYWFYLLTHGGTVKGQIVYGIGMDKAAKIVYRNLTHYMQTHSNYQDARLGSIQAAEDLYGSCSNEVAQVKNAWAAVGIGEPNDQLCLEIEGPEQICEDQLLRRYTYTVSGVEGIQVEWVHLPESWFYEIGGYQGEKLTLKGIHNPGEEFELEIIGRTDRLFEHQSMKIEFVPCSPGDTVPDAGKQPETEPIPDWTVRPNGERMYITLPESSYPANIELFDVSGRRIHHLFTHERTFSLEIQGITDGIYFLRVDSPRGPVHKVFRLLR